MRDSFSCYSGGAGMLFNASSEHSEIFISVFYPNWLIIRKFYLNLRHLVLGITMMKTGKREIMNKTEDKIIVI